MPDSFTNWLKFTPAGVPSYRRSYIDLPSFSYSGLSWSGASVIVAQFNFSATSNFILLNRPTKPLNVNYGLCVRYRVGETVYRYKLWQDTNFVLNDDGAPIYNGQIIKKNFVLEIWSLNGQSTASQASSIRMFSSLRSLPTDINVTTDYALAVGAEFTTLDNTNPTLPAVPTYRWTCDGNNTTIPWTDSIAGQVFSTDGVGANPTLMPADSTWAKGRWKFVDGSNRRMFTVFPSMPWSTYQMYIVASVGIGAGLNRELFSLDGFQLAKLGNTDKVRYGETGTFDLTIPDNGPHIFNLSKAEIALFGRIDELSNSTVADGSATTAALQFQIAEAHSGANVGEINIAEVLIFKDQWHAIGTDFDLQVLKYLRWYHFGEIPLDMSFNTGGAWLDNV